MRRLRVRCLLRLVLAASSLTFAAPAAAADPEVHVFTAGNAPPGERRPLLIFLHGLGGSGAEALANPTLRALAEEGRMVVVAPDGTLDRQGRRFWNAGPACCNFDGKAVNDVARLEALIAHWLERPEIRSRARLRRRVLKRRIHGPPSRLFHGRSAGGGGQHRRRGAWAG